MVGKNGSSEFGNACQPALSDTRMPVVD